MHLNIRRINIPKSISLPFVFWERVFFSATIPVFAPSHISYHLPHPHLQAPPPPLQHSKYCNTPPLRSLNLLLYFIPSTQHVPSTSPHQATSDYCGHFHSPAGSQIVPGNDFPELTEPGPVHQNGSQTQWKQFPSLFLPHTHSRGELTTLPIKVFYLQPLGKVLGKLHQHRRIWAFQFERANTRPRWHLRFHEPKSKSLNPKSSCEFSWKSATSTRVTKTGCLHYTPSRNF